MYADYNSEKTNLLEDILADERQLLELDLVAGEPQSSLIAQRIRVMRVRLELVEHKKAIEAERLQEIGMPSVIPVKKGWSLPTDGEGNMVQR